MFNGWYSCILLALMLERYRIEVKILEDHYLRQHHVFWKLEFTRLHNTSKHPVHGFTGKACLSYIFVSFAMPR